MTIYKKLPPYDYLHHLFLYKDGDLYWKNPNSYRVKTGDIAGWKADGGYLKVTINGRDYAIHRIIWKLCKGLEPRNQIDHIDQNKMNNKIDNLRDNTTSKQQQRNQPMYKNNTSGFTGVNWVVKKKKWRASITLKGKLLHLGYFDKKDDAIHARTKAEAKYGFHANHGKK